MCFIHLSRNAYLVTIERHAFAGLESLEYLDISCSGVKILVYGMFLHLDECTRLDLHGDFCGSSIDGHMLEDIDEG